MTKFKLISDLHLDFYSDEDQNIIEKWIIDQAKTVDFIIIAGDLYEDHYYNQKLIQKMDNCLFVKGNHDYYADGNNNNVSQCLWTRNINGIKVLGTTLWTNFNNNNPLDKIIFTQGMRDPFKIKPFGHALAETVYTLHIDSVNKINQYKPDLVITHHCPTSQSVHPMYLGDPMNHSFFSSYDEKFFSDWDFVKVWCYGHTHWRHEYKINNTQFYCNPVGYPSEIMDIYSAKVFEL